jgi:hypothetical protein
MSTLEHSLGQLDGIASAAEKREAPSSVDDGLGCMRGLAIAMLFNAALVLIGCAAWIVWRWLK